MSYSRVLDRDRRQAMTEEMENLGQAIDRVDSLAHGLQLPIHDSMHVAQLKKILPEVVAELKAAFVNVTGQNPWEEPL